MGCSHPLSPQESLVSAGSTSRLDGLATAEKRVGSRQDPAHILWGLPEPITLTIEVKPVLRSIEWLKAAAERQAPLLYALISLPNLQPQQWQGVGHRSGASESVYLVDILSDPSLH